MTWQDLIASLRRGPFAWPGGYAIRYLCNDGETLCSACVYADVLRLCREIRDVDRGRVVAEYIHWEGDPEWCASCNAELPSEYGPVDP